MPSVHGQLIRHKRQALGLSRGELVKRSGLSYSTIKNAENGKHSPVSATRVKLAAALDLPELIEPEPPVREMLAVTSAQALAALLARYNPSVLVEALLLAKVDLWGLFATLFPASAAAAQTMASVDVAALVAEQGGGHG